MIFNDQDTARKFREEAEAQLKEWAKNIFKQGQRYPNVDSEDSIMNFVESEAKKIPAKVALLLYRSGMILTPPDDDEDLYPVILYYDRDPEHKVADALIASPDKLLGGIVNGTIHT